MTQVMMPYILPLLLGRTINLDTMEVGIDVFPKSVIDNAVRIQNPVTETHYKVVDNAVESRDLLDVDGSFSLNVKGGLFKAGASGAYLADTYNRESTVEVAVRAVYQVVTEQLPPDAKPYDLWKTFGEAVGTHYVHSITYGGELIASVRIQCNNTQVTEQLPPDAKPYDLWKTFGDAVGTHYVHSITYGGELIASVRIQCNNTRDKQRIKAGVDVGGRIEIFDVGVEVEGEYMKDVSKNVESTQIKVFSSIPLSKAPNDMDTLKEVLENFPQDLNDFNGGRGIPIKMELWPLSVIDPSRPAQIRNRVLEANLDAFEQKFDDLMNTKTAISDWMKVMSKPLSKENEKKVGELYAEVQKVIRPFYEVIGSLDMTKSSDQLKPANQAYGLSIPGVYYKKYLLLRQAIARDQGEWTMTRGNGATYIHWGKENCTGSAEMMSNGTVLGPSGYGGGSNFQCLPQKPYYGNPPTNKKDAAVLLGTSYQFPNGQPQKLSCSTCRLAARGSVHTFIGKNQCPENWDYLYDGILMSGSRDSISTQFICLDRKPVETGEGDENALVPDWGLIAGDEDENQILFICVVCAK